jgi:chemotaxis protein methyltransferase WspC
MPQAAIMALLRHIIGLNPDAIGPEVIARAVRHRMVQCSASDTQTYLERIQTSEQELHALIEAVVVPETWFFRDQMPFAYLGRYVMVEWLPTHQHAVFRVLSLACSTGEEPYSIAMTLLDTGLAPQQVRIDAVDISHQALRQARGAVYGNHAFRGHDLQFRERYCEQSQEGYRICARVQSMVTFKHGNVLDAHLLTDQAPYSIIFCRNLLIYLDAAARSRALQVLDRLLTPHGILFVGYAETGLLLTSGYMPVHYPRAFAYQKGEAPHDPQHRPRLSGSARPHTPHVAGQPMAAAHRRQWPPSPAAPGAVAQEPSGARATQASVLETARRLADQGELETAATLCETTMQAHGPSAQAYVLLGLIRQAAGNLEQAEHCFSRAAYLQPEHYEALIHLALLMERRGETGRAAILRQRAQRTRYNAR